MAKSNLAQKHTAALNAFNVSAWRTDLTTAAVNLETSASRMLQLVLDARGVVEADTVKEAVGDAVAAGICAANQGVTDDEARASKSFKNRVADAMAIFKAETLPATMRGNLQHAASDVRAHAKATGATKGRAPRQPVAKVDAKDVNPLALLEAALEALTQQCGDNRIAASLVGDLKELAVELANELSVKS